MKRVAMSVLVILLLLLTVMPALADTDEYSACWGQATAAFAQMGEMGEHASQQPTPREGLANLAQRLFDEAGVGDGTLQGLAAYLVSIDPDLTIDACM